MADWISSTIGAVGNIFDSGLSIAASAKAAKRQYEYQRLLNQQAYDLTQKGYRESYGNMRLGLENAGYNPILAVNSNPYTGYSGGSATGMQPNINSDISGKSVNAYRAFKLEKDRTSAEVKNLGASTENINAKTKTEGYNQQLLQSEYLLNQINTELAKKDLSWKDRMYLMHEKTGYIQAAAAHLGAEAQQLNANTAKQHLQLDREMQNIINYKTKVENDLYNRSKGSFRADVYRGVRGVARAIFGR